MRNPCLEISTARRDVLFFIKEEGAAASNQGDDFGGVIYPQGGRGPNTAPGGGGFRGGGGGGIPTGVTYGNFPNGMPVPKAMFEKRKVHLPESSDSGDKVDPSIWLGEMERCMNNFATLQQDGLDRINYTTSLLKGDANS